MLAPGGRIFIDDYVARAELNASERASLADKLYCTYLPPQQVYIADLEKAGFTDIQAVDKTADWKSFVVARLDAFRAQRTAIVESSGTARCRATRSTTSTGPSRACSRMAASAAIASLPSCRADSRDKHPSSSVYDRDICHALVPRTRTDLLRIGAAWRTEYNSLPYILKGSSP